MQNCITSLTEFDVLKYFLYFIIQLQQISSKWCTKWEQIFTWIHYRSACQVGTTRTKLSLTSAVGVYFTCCMYVDSPYKLNKVVYTISKCDVLSSLKSGFGPNCFTYFQMKFLKALLSIAEEKLFSRDQNWYIAASILGILQKAVDLGAVGRVGVKPNCRER